jgi:hypothetical protein
VADLRCSTGDFRNRESRTFLQPASHSAADPKPSRKAPTTVLQTDSIARHHTRPVFLGRSAAAPRRTELGLEPRYDRIPFGGYWFQTETGRTLSSIYSREICPPVAHITTYRLDLATTLQFFYPTARALSIIHSTPFIVGGGIANNSTSPDRTSDAGLELIYLIPAQSFTPHGKPISAR